MQETTHNETSLGLCGNESPAVQVQAEGQATVIVQTAITAGYINVGRFSVPAKSISQHLDLLVPPEHQKDGAFSYPITVYDDTGEIWKPRLLKCKSGGLSYRYLFFGLTELYRKYGAKPGDVFQLLHENNRLEIRFLDKESAPPVEELVDEQGRSILVQKSLSVTAVSTRGGLSIPCDVAKRIMAAAGLEMASGIVFNREIQCWDDNGSSWNINIVHYLQKCHTTTKTHKQPYFLKGPGLRDFLTARNAQAGDAFRLSLDNDDGKLYIGLSKQEDGSESLSDELEAEEELAEDLALETEEGEQEGEKNEVMETDPPLPDAAPIPASARPHPPVPPPGYDPYILKARLDAALQREEWLKRQVRHLKAEVRFGQVAEKRARELSRDVNRLNKELSALKRQRME